jgi:4-azaleucine resistance transporter AzlC
MTAMFVVIFLEQWFKEKDHTASVLGLTVTALCLILFGADAFMIPTMLLILIFLAILRKKLEKKEADNP